MFDAVVHNKLLWYIYELSARERIGSESDHQCVRVIADDNDLWVLDVNTAFSFAESSLSKNFTSCQSHPYRHWDQVWFPFQPSS
jgi:hypothetical protein